MNETRNLVIDDEPLITKTVQAYLEQEGFTVQSVADGPAAIKIRMEYPLCPDLGARDIMLHGMDGPEVFRRLYMKRFATSSWLR